MTNEFVNCLALDSSGTIFCGTEGSGVFKSESSTTAIINTISELPSGFRLEQNYPNPFNPSTIITYSIPRGSFVTLKIYDILGNEIATLVNEEEPAGNYKINFNGNRLSSGVYFYRIQAGDLIATKKLILIK